MQPDVTQSDVRAAVMACLEKIVDPCSVASGVPAGLVSMGLVGPVEIKEGRAGAKVHVTLYITEPGCLMGSLFELTAGLPDAKLVVVPGGGHAANLTHPEAVNPAIAAFLDGLVPH